MWTLKYMWVVHLLYLHLLQWNSRHHESLMKMKRIAKMMKKTKKMTKMNRPHFFQYPHSAIVNSENDIFELSMLKVIDTISNWYHRTSMFHFSTCKICKRSVRAFRKCSPPLLSKSLMNSITNYLSTNDCLLPTSVPQNQFWAHVLPPYQSSSINFNYAAIGVKIRSKRRSYNFTKYVIANRDHLPCTLVYDTAPPIFLEESSQLISYLLTCQLASSVPKRLPLR